MKDLLSLLAPATGALPGDVSRDRYRGALLGLAVGNGLGGPVEGFTAEQIRAFRAGGISEIPAAERYRSWDDDVAQAVVLAECLLAGPLDIDDFLERLVRWAEIDGRGIGRQTHSVLARARSGLRGTEAAAVVWRESGRWAAGNGAVMRCAPVALRWRREPLRLIEDAGHSARVTHYDPRCVWSTVAVCSVLAHALAGTHTTLQELADAVAGVGAPEEVVDAILRASTAELADLELDETRSMGYTVRTMTAGLWAFLSGDDFEEMLLTVINAGGDTDTNGAVAGAVLGARFGATAIPERWLAALPDPGGLTDLADRLWSVCAAD